MHESYNAGQQANRYPFKRRVTPRASLMITCLGDTVLPRTGMAAVGVLQRLGGQVGFPRSQACAARSVFHALRPVRPGRAETMFMVQGLQAFRRTRVHRLLVILR